MKAKNLLLLIVLMMLPGITWAQESDESKSFLEQYMLEVVVVLAVVICVVALLALLVAWFGLRAVLNSRAAEEGKAVVDDGLIAAREGEEHLGFWGRLWSRMNYSGSIKDEASVATDHEYDGIRELDNQLPPWWLYGFYFTIIFGVIYWIRFETIGSGASQLEEYEIEMAQAEADVQAYLASLGNLIDETNVTLATDQVDLDAGKAIYDTNCSVCHAADGGGGVGPNFTDKNWIHGGDMPAIFGTIKYGVPAKGMIAWESQLSAKQMQQVASYIYNMEGSTTANPKEPQGDLFERSEPESGDDEPEETVDS